MFGDISMYGTRIQKTDDKNRIVLPSFTHANNKDMVVLARYGDDVSVYPLKYVDSVVKSLEEKIASETDEIIKESLSYALNQYLDSLITTLRVDSQGRIVATGVLARNTMYKVVGARTHVKIKKL